MTTANELEQEWERLDGGVPLALLPVRLETRFDGGELLIRIEPDVLHHDLHVDLLRPDERALGEQFWAASSATGARAEDRSSAWRTLAATLGPWRAAWVARAVRLGAPAGEQRGRPALARLLPRRWVAKAWFDGKSAILGWSKPVRARLSLGFDLDDPSWTDDATLETDEREGRLSVDPEARWMIDFGAAEAAGMAIRVTLAKFTQLEAHLKSGEPIDQLLVVGVDPELDAETAGERLGALCEAQRYTRGLELVPQGVPTNNTEEVQTGLSPGKPDLDALMQRELAAWLPAAAGQTAAERVGPRSLGGRLARALGQDPSGLVQRLEHAATREDEGAAAMNRLLWPLTWGELFGNLLAGVEKPAQNRLVDRAALGPLEDWFAEHVRGGSSIATLRVGPQPFGVLPVRKLRRREPVTTATSLSQHVNDAVARLRETWREVLPRVPTTTAAHDTESANATLLRILASQPHPWEFSVQRASDCREVLGREYGGCAWSAALHVPALVLMPGWRFGEPTHASLKIINQLAAAAQPNADNMLFGILACWAQLLFSESSDRLPEVLATPDTTLRAQLEQKLPKEWVDAWALDAIIWRSALRGKPLPARPRSIDDLIAYVVWLAGDQNWLAEALTPQGFWAAYLLDLVQRRSSLEAANSPANARLLAHCRSMLERIGDMDTGPTQLLQRARAALELHRERIAPLEPWYAQWGRSARLLTHIQQDGPTGAFLAYEDADVGVIAPGAPLVQAATASAGDRAAAYLAELGSAVAGTGWDAERLASFAAAARTAKKPAGLRGYRARDMSGERPPPLLFQLARAALTATEGNARARVQRQLQTLATLDPAELELRLRESLGLSTHRLDAWATALATEALFAQREKRPHGLQLGAYGWLENLKPDDARASQGYLLAPSLAHAATAAVLRAGWTGFDSGGAGPDAALAVDVSSSRVRLGQWLLDGLRQGRSAGDLLGYRFERALHDHNLDRCIDDVRRRVANATGRGNERQPVDGMELWNLWRADDATLRELARATPGLAAEFAALGSALDAVLDLTSAESVYQLVQGNMARAAASLDALGLPDVDPPECSFPLTPRAGRTITHRLILSLSDASPIAAGDGWASSPRSAAAPALERWVRSVLGPASAYRISTRWVDATGVARPPNPAVAGSALGLSALDMVYLVGDGSEGGARLRMRLISALAADTEPGLARLEVLPDAREGLAPGQETCARLVQLARRVRDLLGNCQPAQARHLCQPGVDASDTGDVVELVGRARAAAAQLAAVQRSLAAALPDGLRTPLAAAQLPARIEALLASPADIDARALGVALLEVDRFAIEANPPPMQGGSESDNDAALRGLLRIAVSAARALAARLAQIDAQTRELQAGARERQRAAARAIFDAAFGRDFPVSESFRLPSDAAGELEQSLAASGTRPGQTAGSDLHWLSRVARVQPGARLLADALFAQAGSEVAPVPLHTVQLPHHLVDGAPERWAATGLPNADQHPRLCLLCCGQRPRALAADAASAPLQALLVDQWTETIPDAQQTAAVAFHHAAPASRPPQAILLAMVPDGQTGWTCDDVLATVRETFEWAHLRAVGPEELALAKQNYSQYLPAAFSPVPFELSDTLLQGAADLTHHYRLEGKTTTEDLEPGLQVRIADPMWMLARQWQLGEFQGEDESTPVYATIDVETAPLASLRLEPNGSMAQKPVPITAPDALEAYAEAQDPRSSPGAYGARASAGLRFLSMLAGAGLGSLVGAVRAAFPLPPFVANVAGEELGDAGQRQLAELSRRALDAVALAGRLRSDATLANAVAATPAQRRTLAAVAAAWLAQFDVDDGALGAASGWAPQRLEYGLSIAASGADGELTLRAEQYEGGRLDWHAFDMVSKGRHGLAQGGEVRRHVRIPAPLRYAGMPADRFWEIEDGEVNFGGIQTTPADLPRLLITRFALSQGPDWFHVPISLPSGRLARVKAMHVVDSFGRKVSVPSLAVRDHAAGRERPWRMFELTGDPGPAAGQAPWLLLAPALPQASEGPAIERVQFLRDETSNLVWAIEGLVEGPLGDAIDRTLIWKRSGVAKTGTARAPSPGSFRYEVAPPTPSYLVPFIPERGRSEQVRLRRGRVHRGLDAEGRPISSGAVGQILNPGSSGAPLHIFEEEIPRGGIEVSRAWQLARDRQGRVWLWLGQRKRPRGPSKEPGIVFDRLTKP